MMQPICAESVLKRQLTGNGKTISSFACYNGQGVIITYYYTPRQLAAAQCIVIGPVCVFAGGRAVSEPYRSQRARSVCVSLSAFFI